MSYFGIGFSFIFDVLIFDISFAPLEVIGVCICLFFTLVTAIYKQYFMAPKKQDPAPEAPSKANE